MLLAIISLVARKMKTKKPTMVMAGYDDDDVIGTDVTEIFRSQRLWTVPANDVCALVPREPQLWKLMTICSAGVALHRPDGR